MTFDSDKNCVLQRPDKSKSGSMDEAVKPVCDLINSSKDYYTTSSCAGRIVLMCEPEDHKKTEVHWLFVSHEPTDFETLKVKLVLLPQQNVWLRQEGMALHVACRTHKDAFRLVGAARKAGLKRSGVISSGKKIIVEILDTERLELPIAVGGKVVVSEEYFTLVLDIANKKLERTRKKMKRLEEELNQLFSF